MSDSSRCPAHEEIHIWIARVDDCFDHAPEDEWLATLPPEDRARCLRTRVDSVRRERIVSRVLIRRGLSLFGERPASSWRFTENEFGRPLALDAGDLTFNASHSQGLVVCAFARGREVGIDTESFLRRVPEQLEFGRFLSARETQQLFLVPEDKFARTFFRYWTLKEAYAKARGIGISIGFDKFSIELTADENSMVESTEDLREVREYSQLLDDRISSSWHLREISVPNHHLVGLAAERCAEREKLVILVRTVSSF